jgi:glucose/arabinose dehydrogenase
MRKWLAFCCLAFLGAACGGGGTAGTASPSPSSNPSPTASESVTPSASPTVDLSAVRIRVVPFARLEQPIAMATRQGDDALYVAEKTGRVRVIRDGRVVAGSVVDLSGQVSQGFEQGLLGLAFSPGGRFMYVNYTDLQGDTQIVEFAATDTGVDAASRRTVLSIQQTAANHNGGNLAFGPDGYLYIGMGDGGGGGSPNGQRLDALLGKMLRIDPRPSGGRPYSIPDDNPFVGRKGARGEIWDFGLRNPWRWSFDPETGDLWIGDVGAGDREEIDFEPGGSTGGRNYGWDLLEGTVEHGSPPPNAVPPVYEHPTGDLGRAIVGGYVYRGTAIPELVGAYLFADFYNPRIMGLVERNGKIVQDRPLGPEVEGIMSFGQDQQGELYVLSFGGTVYRIEEG